MMVKQFAVRAKISGPGRITSDALPSREAAQKFADTTNRERPGSNARVVSVRASNKAMAHTRRAPRRFKRR